MQKIYRIGTTKIDRHSNQKQVNADIFIKARYLNEGGHWRLSISGVIGPKANGDAWGGAGQIDMEFEHRYSKDNDERYLDNLIKPSDITFADGWNAKRWCDLLDIWKRYHLNNMHAECEHQRALGWMYKTHEGQKCPTCGYQIGTEWKFEDVPQTVIDTLLAMPDADKAPAWI